MNRKRIDADVLQLMESEHEVTLLNGLTELCVKLSGPKETPYEGIAWRVRVTLPDAYPFKSPSVSFIDPILHPNVDVSSGAVCLDVLNQTWSPLFSLVNIFDSFLPQLLRYPNPDHPLNKEAASAVMKEPDKFAELVKLHSAKFDDNKKKKFSRKCIRRNNKNEGQSNGKKGKMSPSNESLTSDDESSLSE